LLCGPWYDLPERSGSHHNSGGTVSRDISGASRSMGEGNENLVYLFPWDLKRYLTCSKILQHGTSGFTFHPKESVLQIFIVLQNPSRRPGSNPRLLGPVASTLTTTPPKRLGRFWWEIPKEGDHLEDQGVGGKMGSECILGRLAWGVWIGCDWLRTGTDGGLL
jgi:hypothetical protein